MNSGCRTCTTSAVALQYKPFYINRLNNTAFFSRRLVYSDWEIQTHARCPLVKMTFAVNLKKCHFFEGKRTP